MKTERPKLFRHRLLPLALPAAALACALAGSSGAVALAAGFVAVLIGANTAPDFWRQRSHDLLQLSVIGLGAGIDLPAAARAGLDGLGITLLSISLVLTLGHLLGRRLRVPRHATLLISAGTAICGGSAIAALAAVLRPKSHETTAALAVVFVLNAVALVLFPPVGHALRLSQSAFGWWAALAIHDTSSVVGASLAYGHDALILATTIKLARALWIVPLAFAFARWERFRQPEADADTAPRRPGFPWFIAGFLALATLGWLCPAWHPLWQGIFAVSRRTLVATLFLIGSGLAPAALRHVGWRPLALGLGLWTASTVGALAFALAIG